MSLTASKKAFNNDEAFALAFVEGMDQHFETDTCLPGSYDTCAIGCNVDVVNRYLGIELSNYNHSGLADAIGVPEQLLWQQDMIFEGLPSDDRRAFPRDFAHALAECRDITYVWQRQMLWLLREELSLFGCRETGMVADLYERWVGGDQPSNREFSTAVRAVKKVWVATEHNPPLYRFCAACVALSAVRAPSFPNSASGAVADAAMARGLFLEDTEKQGEERYESYRRQRDNLLKILRGA